MEYNTTTKPMEDKTMIKANEIRIGNWVFDDDGIVSRVTGFKPYDYSVRCDEEEGCQLLVDLYPQDGRIRKGYDLDINFASPIPLTEEWLLKFGFEDKKTCFNLSKREILGHDFGDFAVSKYDDTQMKVWRGDRYIGVCHIQHVHSLQNLYFCLRGEELTIKEVNNE